MSKLYMADCHLGHANAIKFDKRPFASKDIMDDTIINNINKKAKENDELYLDGDFSWYDEKKTIELVKKINCKNIYLIKGNHDQWAKYESKKYFKEICDYKRVNDNGKIVILSHYPMAVWDQSHRGSIHLYGHVHTNENDGNITHKILLHQEMENAYNIGVMMPWMNWGPVTLEELFDYFKK
jgi:calcineurin-like phosphoesterase family protein